MYTDVLLATDGSDCARTATEHAVHLAAVTGATLHALYVIETRTEYDSAIVDPETVERTLRSEGEAILESVEAAADAADVEAVCRIQQGVPEREILTYADGHDVDLICLGSRGTSTFKTILLGSTSEAVLREASVPVVVQPENSPTSGE
ncbi:universal stress protein [Natronorubrum sp. JWXQ-INN-674]|uniref:Universal stress protein n=1 Tax=Natronorubrum halalkaliphilum TaxID=2691917 RepID=A0A6B0VU48_9EURY|nr:universal stress protein [Natronorubrum halalkaliphilum]MXV64079.1 universal stress protein [Natronorubrum halalkaliphilum]